ncbi:MAG: small subunit ribosomal protein S9 [Candidatus Berkelbacteria bacterium Licking1014_2]|uniref:Small ribosomal subunit protein uS9 n=1 Tax=Candidatus Berkelbacteria bacterium Licking1014_2 TaxID=2017146 RepID=A0A554LWJ5_9BACT|nr:MAG: small subunit ribosomal protein S9 [Candidatus Berkelbacteria bacterium Licking1014_2]
MAEAKKPIFYQGVGRRKRAVARVRLFSGGGNITINNLPGKLPAWVEQPLELIGLKDKFDINVLIKGGGWHSQLEAVRHGISRAALIFNKEFKSTLRKAGFLTRDPREKERKKPGLKRARRAPQWQKR